MRTIKLVTFTLLILAATYSQVRADITNVPNILAAPMVLYDEGGNPLEDGDYRLTIAMKDASGNTLYEEEQQITVTNHVAPITIGQGFVSGSDLTSPAGGLSKETFDVSSDVTVEITIEGQQNAQEAAVLTSQPFSFITDYALSVANNAITTYSIKDGTITADDLEASFLQSLQNVTVVNESGETLTAKSVSVSSDIGLNNSGSSTVHSVLQDLDSAITSIKNLNIADLSTTVESNTGNISTNTGNISTNTGNISTNTGNISTNTGNISTNTGNISTNTGNISTNTGNIATNASNIELKLNKSGDAMTGGLTINTTPAGNPTPNTLYKGNMVVAWARVNAYNGASPALDAGFNIASVERDPNGLGSHYYKIVFKTNPVDGGSTGNAIKTTTVYSYAVIGTVVREAKTDRVLLTHSTHIGYFIVHIQDPAGYAGNDQSDTDFSVMVLGGTLL